MVVEELAPLDDIVAKCNRCGFCQAGCPVYRVTGQEHSLSRGRMAIARELLLGRLELTGEVVEALDDCLLCRGCTAHCFPALKTDQVVTAIRYAYLVRQGQPAWQRVLFRSVLANSKRLEWAGRMAVFSKRTGLTSVAERAGAFRIADRRIEGVNEVLASPGRIFLRGKRPGTDGGGALVELLPGALTSCLSGTVEATSRALCRARRAAGRLQDKGVEWTLAKRTGLSSLARRSGILRLADRQFGAMGEALASLSGRLARRVERSRDGDRARCRIGYFVSCGLSFQFPEVVEATLRVLNRAGCAVAVLDNTCCGRPASAYGDLDAARDIARRNVERLASAMHLDAIVSDCGSCSTYLKEYGELLSGDAGHAERAAALSRKVRSFSEFVAAISMGDHLAPVEATVTYHDPCHLSRRFANITAQPRALLRALPGLSFKEMAEADWCCGAAGSYTFLHHAEAKGILDRKMINVEKTGAAILATECPSCMMHLAFGARHKGLRVDVQHVSQILDRASATP